MTILSDITVTPLSGYKHIDSLLNTGPDWNFLGRNTNNTLTYTFSVSSGNESGRSGQAAFSLAQQAATRMALADITALTGIRFAETAIGSQAQIHLASVDILQANTTGLFSWATSYTPPRSQLAMVSDYSVQTYVYLDNVEFRAANANLVKGSSGYETLLHELGHMLGLKHPFEGDEQLPYDDDHTANTLMSYDSVGGPYGQFSQYDIAALNWLYGRDGLGGLYGVGGFRDYVTGTDGFDELVGTAANERFEGAGGVDYIDGGAGVDIASYLGPRANYDIISYGGFYEVIDRKGGEGDDLMVNIDMLQFADISLSFDYESVVQALYVGYFGRAADYNGMLNFQKQLGALNAPTDFAGLAAAYTRDTGLRALIDSFAASAESAALYPGATSAFVTAVFQNVLGRGPAAAGLAFWTDAIDNKGLSKANASLSIMAGALENKTAQGVLDAELIDNKLAIASSFTLAIDTAAEIAGYAGRTAAAAVRTLLAGVSAATDIETYQAAVQSTLGSMTGVPRAASGLDDDLPIGHAELIGIGYQSWEQTLV